MGVCVPFPIKQIKANNVIDDIIQKYTQYKQDDEMTIYNDDDEQRKKRSQPNSSLCLG